MAQQENKQDAERMWGRGSARGNRPQTSDRPRLAAKPTIILTKAVAAAVCFVNSPMSRGHIIPGRSSGATSGKLSKSLLSKAS